jgi:hypothetical protein|tara:strand:- start:596 stop:721 length:126 start_codon:yes stop_codon:yes gene_type:complete
MLGHEEQILDEPLVPLKLIDLRLYGGVIAYLGLKILLFTVI